MATLPQLLEDADVEWLRYPAALLAIGVALIHLMHPTLGGPRLILHVQVGTIFDPRPLLFTLAGFLIMFGIVLASQGVLERAIYAGGVVLMLALILGYGAWHTILDHGAFWPHIHGHGHTEVGGLELIWLHLREDGIAMVSKLFEVGLLGVLVVLYLGTSTDEDQ